MGWNTEPYGEVRRQTIPEEDNYAANPMFEGMLLLIYLQLSNPVKW